VYSTRPRDARWPILPTEFHNLLLGRNKCNNLGDGRSVRYPAIWDVDEVINLY
jgi:hypothetical protein